MLRKLRNRLYDSHPGLLLDPDAAAARPIHTEPAFMIVVAVGAFLGTLSRYGVGAALPADKYSWPFAILAVNISGAFALGLLLQVLQNLGHDTGLRRLVRLGAGTGFLGSFTTYSSFAVGADVLVRHGHADTAIAYVLVSLVAGVVASAFGIQVATRHHRRRAGIGS